MLVFATKCADVRILISTVQKISALGNPFTCWLHAYFYGQPLTLTSYQLILNLKVLTQHCSSLVVSHVWNWNIWNFIFSRLDSLRSVYTERDRDLVAFAKEWSKYNKLKSFIQSAKANVEHDFSLFYLDQRRQAAFAATVAFCINRPLHRAFKLIT